MMKRIKKLFALLLVIGLCYGLFPIAAFAEAEGTVTAVSDGVAIIYKILTDDPDGAGVEKGTVQVGDGTNAAVVDSTASVTISDTVTSNGETYDVTAIGDSAFFDCTSLTSVNIPAGVKTIGDSAFRGCAKLESVILPADLTTIRESAFRHCLLLKTINIPNGVTVIDNNAFHECTALESLDIPDGVTTIEAGMFDGCTSLKAVIIPENVTAIGNGAFHNCDALTTLIIPGKVESIGRYALGGCANLTEVTFEGETAPTMEFEGSGAFGSESGETSASNGIVHYPNDGTGYDKQGFTNYLPADWDSDPYTTPPEVTGVSPTGTGAEISGSVVIAFDEAIGTAGTVTLNNEMGILPATNANLTDNIYTIPYSGLAYGTEYRVTISGFRDAADNVMDEDNAHSFITRDAPPTYNVTLIPAIGGTATATPEEGTTSTIIVLSTLEPNYSFVQWNVSPSVTWMDGSATSWSTAFAMPSGNVTVTPVYRYIPPINGSITPSSVTFDRNPDGEHYQDVLVTLFSGDYVLSAFTNDGYTLQEGMDYAMGEGHVIIKKEYLATLNTGEQTSTFDMSGGVDPVLTVTLTDTTPTIYAVNTHFGTWTGQGTATASVDAERSKFLRLLHGGREVDAANYTVTEGSTVIILSETYLHTVANGSYTFRVEFTDGYTDLTLTVSVEVPTPSPAQPDNVPKTGDDTNGGVWTMLFGLSGLHMLGTLLWRKGRREKGA